MHHTFNICTYIEVAVVLYSSSPQASLSNKDSSGFISCAIKTIKTKNTMRPRGEGKKQGKERKGSKKKTLRDGTFPASQPQPFLDFETIPL